MITLKLGDSIEEMKSIPEKSIDFILCDLPYGMTAPKWDQHINIEKLWEEYNRIIKKDGTIALFSSQPFTTKLIHSKELTFFMLNVCQLEKLKKFVFSKKVNITPK